MLQEARETSKVSFDVLFPLVSARLKVIRDHDRFDECPAGLNSNKTVTHETSRVHVMHAALHWWLNDGEPCGGCSSRTAHEHARRQRHVGPQVAQTFIRASMKNVPASAPQCPPHCQVMPGWSARHSLMNTVTLFDLRICCSSGGDGHW